MNFFAYLTHNGIPHGSLYCNFTITVVSILFIGLSIAFSSDLQANCRVFLTRVKGTDNSLFFKASQVSFFFSFMLPTRVFLLSPLVQSVSFFLVVFGTLCAGVPIVRMSLLAWFFLCSENLTLGFFYHRSAIFKTHLDSLCGGADLVLFFLGNTGTIAYRESIKGLKALGTASGAIMLEDLAINVYSFGDAHLQRTMNPAIDFNTAWKTTKADLAKSLPLRGLKSFVFGQGK